MNEISRTGKSIVTDAKGWVGKQGTRGNCFRGMGSPFGVMSKFWSWAVVMVAQHEKALNATDLYTLVKMVVLCYVFYVTEMS